VGEKPRTVRIDRGDGIEIRTFDGWRHGGVSWGPREESGDS
jgi:hypothetical protein